MAIFHGEVRLPKWFQAAKGNKLWIKPTPEASGVTLKIVDVILTLLVDQPCRVKCPLGHEHPPLNISCEAEWSEETEKSFRESNRWFLTQLSFFPPARV